MGNGLLTRASDQIKKGQRHKSWYKVGCRPSDRVAPTAAASWNLGAFSMYSTEGGDSSSMQDVPVGSRFRLYTFGRMQLQLIVSFAPGPFRKTLSSFWALTGKALSLSWGWGVGVLDMPTQCQQYIFTQDFIHIRIPPLSLYQGTKAVRKAFVVRKRRFRTFHTSSSHRVGWNVCSAIQVGNSQ